MGCISSKLLAAVDLGEDLLFDDVDNPDAGGVCPNHFVSLTSTTYGALKLDYADEKPFVNSEALPEQSVSEGEARPPDLSPQPAEKEEENRPSEVIDAQELMGDLASETPGRSPAQRQKPPKPSPPMHRSPEVRGSTSPAKPRKWSVGKENTPLRSEPKRSHFEAHRIADPFRSLDNTPWISFVQAMSRKRTPNSEKGKRSDKGSNNSRSRRSLSPLFDPELVSMFELEHCEEGKKITTRAVQGKAFEAATLLQSYERKCPGGGENAVVLYTTTLRGIRKTFEDCNAVRSLVESYGVRVVERDTSMDSGYREELRLLMGKKDVKVPLVFVKGRCIGGFEEIARLEDEAKLELLLEGLPSAVKWCDGCGGLRFVMCMDCNGSRKVLDSKQNKVQCGECNENGLIHCPICC